MFIDFLRKNVYAAFGLTLLRVYLGWTWLQAGWEKLTEGKFDASGFLKGAVTKATGEHPAVQGWWAHFLGGWALPNVSLFNAMIPWGEFLTGVGLILGSFTILAGFMGVLMNFSYMFSGAISTNPQMIIIGVLILVAGFNAGKVGLDRWIIPFIKKQMSEKNNHQTLPQSVAQ